MSTSELKARVQEYRDLDNKLREVNAKVQELRRVRSEAEDRIVEIIRRPEFSEFKKLEISDDGSTIRIQRPKEWNKPWSLSKSLLKQMLDEYYKTTNSPNSQECYHFICETMKPMLVSDSLNIERTVK
jgi:chromosome segregation ATPase